MGLFDRLFGKKKKLKSPSTEEVTESTGVEETVQELIFQKQQKIKMLIWRLIT